MRGLMRGLMIGVLLLAMGSGLAADTVSVRVGSTTAIIGWPPAPTLAVSSYGTNVNGLVVGLVYDPKYARVAAQRPEDLPTACEWQAKTRPGAVCIGIACPVPVGGAPRAIAKLAVTGCRPGSTQLRVAPGACPEDTCMVGYGNADQACVSGLEGTLTVTGALTCAGDCNRDGHVTIAEVRKCMSAYSGADVCTCPNADVSGDGRVGLDEVQKCVNHFLAGC